MKSIFLFLIMFVAFNIGAQTQAKNCKTLREGSFKESTDKNGKKTIKECLWVSVCDDLVEFRVTNTTVKSFQPVGGVWVNSSEKLVTRVVQPNGLIVFHDGKAAFAYTPSK